MQRCPIDVVQDTSGNCIPDAAIYVYAAGTSTPATIYSDNGITPILPTGQTTSNALGQITFYAPDGRYDFKVVKTGYADTWYRDLLFDDPISWMVDGQWVDVRAYNVVGDGVTDDTAHLSNAINSNPGKIVVIPSGFNCLVSSRITITATGVQLYAPNATITQSPTMTDNDVFLVTAQDVVFTRVRIAGASLGLRCITTNSDSTGDGITLDGCVISGFNVAGLLQRTSRVKVRNCHFYGNTSVDLAIWDLSSVGNANDILVENNTIDSRGSTSISAIFVGTSSSTYEYTNVKVIGNTINNTVATTSADVCCTLRRCNGALVTANYCYQGSMGVSVDSSSDVSVDNNVIINPAYYGVEVAGTAYGSSNRAVVSNNTVQCGGLATYGIALQGTVDLWDCTVIGNSIYNPLVAGVFVYEWCDYTTISGNTIDCPTTAGVDPRGILVYGHSLTTNVINFVNIVGNTLKGSAAFLYGIELRSTNYVNVTGNTIVGFGTSGVLINGSFDLADYIIVAGNTFNNLGGVASAVTTSGTLGLNVTVLDNPGFRYTGTNGLMITDLSTNTGIAWSDTADPESNTAMGVGSLHLGPIPKIKRTGTGTTGWLPMLFGESGTTANRPTTNLFVGRYYFDTTLGKPAFIKSLGPTVWVDGVGTVI